MPNETSNTGSKSFYFSEVLYVFVKNWLWELIIFVAILLGGVVMAAKTPPKYVSHASVKIIATINDDEMQNINYTTLSKMYVKEVAQTFSNDFFVESVGEKNDLTMSAANVSVTTDEEETSFVEVRYTDTDKEASQKKLTALVTGMQDYANERKEDAADVSKNFSANLSIVYIEGSNGFVKTTTQSSVKKTITLAVVVAVAAVAVYVLCVVLFLDKVTSVKRMEGITGTRNLIVIEKQKIDKGATNKTLSIDISKLADNLMYMQDDKTKVFQLQSAHGGEGKTTVAVNLAVALGANQRKVLVIDCDFSKPNVHRYFGLQRDVGITDYFKGNVDFDGMVKHTESENVDIITCGDEIVKHAIFFVSDKFKAILNEARKKYDFVFLDCAPVKAMTDYILVSPLVDATLLVVKNDRVNSRDLQYVTSELENCKANCVGTVFNFSSVATSVKYNDYGYYKNKKA